MVIGMGHKENVEVLRNELKKQGRIYTPERELLLRVINAMKGKYTLQEFYEKARKRNAIHAKTTIYRNISIFVKAGFIKEKTPLLRFVPRNHSFLCVFI